MGAQATITWWGHATASIEIDGVHVLTDPLLRGRVGPLRWYAPKPPATLGRAADAVVVSHLHRDHLDRRSLALVPAETPIIVPRGAGSLLAGSGHRNVIEMTAGKTVQVSALSVRAVPAVHSPKRDPLRRRPRVRQSTRTVSAFETARRSGPAPTL